MSELKQRIGELAQLMEEFGLETGKLSGEGWLIEFSRSTGAPAPAQSPAAAPGADEERQPKPRAARAAVSPRATSPAGMPISSPMTGIYYSSPSPGAPAFVKEGDHVSAGQVVGLIEAMKVFNEITATVSGTVQKIVAENGQLVNPGDALLYVG